MTPRTIGTDELFPIGLGLMGMSEFYGMADREQSIAVIHHALDHGIRMLDTADMYGSGHNEELLGEALRGRRDQAFVATKFGVVRGPGGSFEGINGKPAYVRRQAEGSLRRLGIDTIDLYYQHRVDPDTPIEETVGEMARLVEEGKVRYLGLSEAAPNTIRRAHAIHPISALETEYSLWTRDPEADLLDLTAELGIAFVAYSPLGRGFLSGSIKRVDDLAESDFRRHNPRFQGQQLERNLQLVAEVEALAAAKGVTPAQLALAWVLSRRRHIIPIPGTRRIERLDENRAAAQIELAATEVARLDAAIPVGAAAGLRYPEHSMATIDR